MYRGNDTADMNVLSATPRRDSQWSHVAEGVECEVAMRGCPAQVTARRVSRSPPMGQGENDVATPRQPTFPRFLALYNWPTFCYFIFRRTRPLDLILRS